MENQAKYFTSDTERRFLFILGSSRRDGNTELLTKIASEHLIANTEKQWLRLQDLILPPFEDIRHNPTAQTHVPSPNEKILLDGTLWATDLVIASPLYWYSVSASTKLYLDYWTYWLRLPDTDFKNRMAGKTMWGICALSDEDLENQSKPLAETLRLTADYLKMDWGGILLGYANRPNDILNDKKAINKAKIFFQ
ncbi:MAG: NAD(P)H-dependent oxidoreductase [Bacteroidetes bacterium]|nr:NAD(P)H-dependent oxidoreductase [Fibrella sp.]